MDNVVLHYDMAMMYLVILLTFLFSAMSLQDTPPTRFCKQNIIECMNDHFTYYHTPELETLFDKYLQKNRTSQASTNVTNILTLNDHQIQKRQKYIS